VLLLFCGTFLSKFNPSNITLALFVAAVVVFSFSNGVTLLSTSVTVPTTSAVCNYSPGEYGEEVLFSTTLLNLILFSFSYLAIFSPSFLET